MTSLNRVTGGNVHIIVTAQGDDPTMRAGFGELQGFIDQFDARYVPTLNTYAPLGEPDEWDQPVREHWEITLGGGDKKALMMHISSYQSQQRRNKRPIPSLALTATAYDPDSSAVAWSYSWSNGTLHGATLSANGQTKEVTASGDLQFKRMTG